ncbi:hypothetical protein ACPA9J_27760 [Pseudomonas aeruginosa]
MVDNSVGGEISSDRAFHPAANTLNNQGGRLISSEALTLRIAKTLDNSLKGQVLGDRRTGHRVSGLGQPCGNHRQQG